MTIISRIYLFQEDGAIKRVPRRIHDALPFGNDAIPEYAGTRQRVAQVLIESEDRRPVRILDATGHYWSFDADGRIDAGLKSGMREWMEVAFSPERKRPAGRIVDLVPEIKKKQLYERDRWDLTNEDLDRIAADIWPGINGVAPEVSTVTGQAPKKPPLTHEAKWALQEIEKQVEAIKTRLAMLSERSLKSLAFEAVRTGLWEDRALWQGVANEATRRQAIRAAHRTGRGEWYAVIELARADNDHPYCWEMVTVVHAKAKSRKAAIEAGRLLMAEKAEWVGADFEISVNIRSALEWQPEDE